MNTKHLWTEEEDEYLRKVVPKKGRVDWTIVMENLNSNFGQKERSAKQCRQRYINYSKFKQRNSQTCKWKEEQLEILFNQFNKLGPRWNKIAKYLPQKQNNLRFRSGNAIKNRFYGGLRKVIRRMNSKDNEDKRKIKKKLKYESVVRIIEAPQSLSNLDSNLKRQSYQIREKIVGLISKNEELSQEDTATLITQINKFNLNTRSYRTKRRKNSPSDDDQDIVDTIPKDVSAIQTSFANSEIAKSISSQPPKMESRVGDKRIEQNIEHQEGGGLTENKDPLSMHSPKLKQFQREDPVNNNDLDCYLLDLFPQQHSPLQNYDLL